jgi:cell division protein FtsB
VGAGGEINQALYAHMNNKRKMKKKKKKGILRTCLTLAVICFLTHCITGA